KCVAGYQAEMEVFAYHKALQNVFEIISVLNKYIDSEAPWKLAKENDPRVATIFYMIWNSLRIASLLLYPFMPVKSQSAWNAIGLKRQIEEAIFEREMRFYVPDDVAPIDKVPPIFPRIET
ncbi:MAG TPA: class I tRNA ligase family protein, partial [Syntrophorhabdaceae bacterium]|nr:class I tRNA ligase family protein [Syntrophorhabdaceae bacterium]